MEGKAGKYIRAISRRAYFSIYPENKDLLHNYNIITVYLRKKL